MKILFLTPSLASWTKQEISILEELDHSVYFLYGYEYRGAKPLPLVQFRFLLALYSNIKMFVKGLSLGLRSDMIFCWFVFPTGVLAVALGKLLRKPTLLNAIGFDVACIPSINYGAPLKWYYRLLISWALRNATKVTAISRDSAFWAEKWGAKDVTVIYEGVDVEKFKPLPGKQLRGNSDFLLLTVSPLDETEIVRKGLKSLLAALHEVVKTVSNVKLIVVGKTNGGYSTLRRMVKDLGIEDNVVFTGFLSDSRLLALYHECDVFVLPSLHEGFPTVCAEAQACEKPVISTGTASMPEVIRDNETGIIVKPRDPEALTDALKRLLHDPMLRKRLGKSGRKRIVQFFSRDIRKKKLQDMLNVLTIGSIDDCK